MSCKMPVLRCLLHVTHLTCYIISNYNSSWRQVQTHLSIELLISIQDIVTVMLVTSWWLKVGNDFGMLVTRVCHRIIHSLSICYNFMAIIVLKKLYLHFSCSNNYNTVSPFRGVKVNWLQNYPFSVEFQ